MWDLEIQNIAGIRSGSATFQKGTNIVQASNFQGKSSLLAAIQTVMGTTGLADIGDTHPLTEGADTGCAILRSDDNQFTIQLHRLTDNESTITIDGDTYLVDEQDRYCARLFAFLGEDNPVRAAVRNEDNTRLTELLQKPIDIEDIDRQIDDLKDEISAANNALDKAEEAANQLPQAQEDVTQLEKEIERLRTARDELEDVVDEDVEGKQLRDELTATQSNLQTIERDIRQLENQIERKESRLEDKRAALADIEIPSQEHETDISEKEAQIDELNIHINLLEELYNSNRQIIQENALDLVTDVNREITVDEVQCWVCGNDTSTKEIEDWLDYLQQKAQSLRQERSTLRTAVSEYQIIQKEIRESKHMSERLEGEIEHLEFEIKEDTRRLHDDREQATHLQDEVRELEKEYQQIQQTEDETSDELKSVQAEIGALENELERNHALLEELNEKAEPRTVLREEIADKREALEKLRGRKEAQLNELVDQFDSAVDDILQTFAPGFDGARLNRIKLADGSSKFELIVARHGRETKLERLSEGEQELVGIAAALAGYRTFDVAERVPCILIDGIGQLAAEHIQNLINYLEDSTEILVTTAYPEAGEFDAATITPKGWNVVSEGKSEAE